MLERLKAILGGLDQINGWKVIETCVEARELFFIRDKLDMNRAKEVKKYFVTIYRDFTEDNKKYRGSSTMVIYPTMSEQEIEITLREASTGAGFVYNEYYPLVEPHDVQPSAMESNFSQQPLSCWLTGLTDTLYQEDKYQSGGINSAEVFLNRVDVRITNSNGVDVDYQKHKCEIEFITTWKGKKEEVELYKQISFADFDRSMITNEVAHIFKMTEERTRAYPTPSFEKQTILLTGEPLKEFFKYYLQQASARQVYEKISTAAIGDRLQGEEIKGDKITMKLDPTLRFSTFSTPYDNDGFPLKEITVIDKGVLTNYWGDQRYSSYLGVKPTGNIGNFVVDTGQETIQEMKREPHLELLAFSDFQMNILTGDFAGEIRLGRYYDGNKTIPVTGGSIAGNIKEVQQEMFLSAEKQISNNFVGPLTVKLYGISVSGS